MEVGVDKQTSGENCDNLMLPTSSNVASRKSDSVQERLMAASDISSSKKNATDVDPNISGPSLPVLTDWMEVHDKELWRFLVNQMGEKKRPSNDYIDTQEVIHEIVELFGSRDQN